MSGSSTAPAASASVRVALLAAVMVGMVVGIAGGAAAQSHEPARWIDSQAAADHGYPASPMAVEIPAGTTAEAAAMEFLHVAGARGAHYAGDLSWVWIRYQGYRTSVCRAPVGLRPDDGDGDARWRVEVGAPRCRPDDHYRGPVNAIRGRLFFQRRSRRLSRGEIDRLSRLLEPERAPSYRRSRRFDRRSRERRRMSRRDLSELSEQLE